MDLPKQIKKQVDAHFGPNEVILFGSRARMDHGKDSDWDFLILLEKPALARSEKEHILEVLYDIELDTGEIINALIHTRQEWERRAITPIYQTIQAEGKKVWAMAPQPANHFSSGSA